MISYIMDLEIFIEGKTSKDIIEIPCSNCGKYFETTKREAQKRIRLGRTSWCCSRECALTLKTMPSKVCLHCGETFQPKYSEQKFCSQHCSGVVNSTGIRRHGNPPTKKYGTREEYYSARRLEAQKKALERLENGEFTDGQRGTLRKYLIQLRGYKCCICHLEEWMGEPIPLVLDHIDGNSDNNFPDNLRLVCANCDRQLPTSKGGNRGNGRKSRRERYQREREILKYC